jgi:ATP-dependent Lon protease
MSNNTEDSDPEYLSSTDDDIDVDDDCSDEEHIYVKSKPSWTRRRLQSEDFTSADNKIIAVKSFSELSNKNPTLTIKELLVIYKSMFSRTLDVGCKWIIDEIEKTILLSRNPDLIRVTKVCDDLKSSLNLEEEEEEEDEDEEEDSEDEEEIDDLVEDSEEGDEECEGIEIEIEEGTANIIMALLAASGKLGKQEGEKDTDNLTTFKKLLTTAVKSDNDTIKFFKELPDEKQKQYIDMITVFKDKSNNKSDLPYLFRLMELDIDDGTKQTIFDNITSFDRLSPSASEYNKRLNLINGIKRLPFGKMTKLPDDLVEAIASCQSNPGDKRKRSNDKMIAYLQKTSKNIDEKIYGHKETKNQTMRLIASMVSTGGSSKGGQCFALCGPPGTGKTQIAGEIAKALGRSFINFNLSGASDGDDLVGHNYAYEGALYGGIARSMMKAGVEDPVLLFDELDKVSKTAKGLEIINVLVHATDSTQNAKFQDKYFAGINIDLSKVVMIFSFNDRSEISPILLDRMKIIKVGGYKIYDKVVIAQKHLIPSIKKELGYNDCNYLFDDSVIRDMINQYTYEGGVRRLKELITDVMMEINLRKLTGQLVGGELPSSTMTITKSIIRDDIFKDRQYVRHIVPSETNQSGLVNGLWANAYGVGGLIPIEAHIIPTTSKFELLLTGMQGDVMQESMKVAKTVAWRLLPEDRKKQLMKKWKTEGPTGFHIHCPDGSTPKDGPSAGGAITTCIVSLMCDAKVDQTYAMTGEINLKGDITAIGGLEEKTFGALTAGIKTILYPLENKRDCDKIKEKFPELFDPTSTSYIKMIPISKIEEILDYVLIK